MQMFMLGMVTMGSAVAALLFLRFWRTTRDRLFLMFAASFGIEVVNRALFAFNGARNEDEMLYFLTRLASFLLILAAIVDKNIARKQ